LHYWTLGDKAHWIRIVPDEITGRRIWSRTSRSDSAATDPSTEKGDSSPESNEEVRDGPASDEQ
jgi:hypothetical protein